MDTIIAENTICDIYRKELLNIFSNTGNKYTFPPKSMIEHGGKPVNFVYLVRQGCVEQYFLDGAGNIKTLLLLTTGDLFGEISFFQQDHDRVITQAYNEVIAEKIPGPVFLKILSENPLVYKYIALMLSNKARILMAQIQDFSFCSTKEKLENLLIRLSVQHGEDVPDGRKIKHRFTHEDFAKMISSTRSTVSKKMKVLEEEGSIEIKNRYIIVKKKLK